MKRFITAIVGSTIFLVILIALVIYRWTITPYGRLHPVMAVIHKLMTLASSYGFFERDNLEEVRSRMTMVKARVPVAGISDLQIEGGEGPIPIRIYRPEGSGPFPVIIYYHGGGFSIGSIASHENISRSIARAAGALVVSVEYRLAPEYPFPAAFEDAYASVEWASKNAADFEGDPSRLAVAGDSAGGNLAAAVALKARDDKGPNISLQILLYATTLLDEKDLESRKKFQGYILTAESGQRVLEYYLPDKADRKNVYASPLLAENLKGLPPAYVMTAAFDPLLDEGKLYAERLEAAGVPVMYRNYEGMLHGFLSFGDLVSTIPPLSGLLKEPAEVFSDIGTAVERWLQ